MTPPAIANQLTAAQWNPVKEDTWQHPKTKHVHSWPVALIVADLPRISNPASLEPSSEKIKRLVHLISVRKVGAVRAGKELGLSPEKVRWLYERAKKSVDGRPSVP